MTKMKKLAAAFAAGLLSVATAYAQDVKKGQDLWMTYSCYACHGYSGNGGEGPKIAQTRFSQTALVNYVRNPPRPNRMPSYSSKVLRDAELADILAFLKSIPLSPAAKDIPLLAEIAKQ